MDGFPLNLNGAQFSSILYMVCQVYALLWSYMYLDLVNTSFFPFSMLWRL